MRLSSALALLAMLPGCATVPPAAPVAPAPRFEAARFSNIVQTFSSDAFEGRGPATPGEQKAVDFIVAQFEQAGVQPGGDVVDGRRQWTQAVPLLRSEFSSDPAMTLMLRSGPLRLTQGEQIALRAPLNGRAAATIANAPLLFVGYGVTAPERGWDDFKGVDVRGKILVELINDPDFDGGEGDFGGKAMTYYGRWTYKYEEAARRGAAGVMIVHETAPASYGWATVKNSNTNSMFDIVRAKPAEAHTGFESWIQRDLAERLFREAGLDFDTAKAAARRKDFRPLPLNATLAASYAASTGTIATRNVVGLLPGKARPDETVILSAHYDHLGIGAPDAKGDRIYNGAVDNATGVAHILEQARAFAAEPRSDRSLVFLALAAEEKGLLGSSYYVANPLYPLGKTVAVINTDSLGVHGPTRDFTISGNAKLDLLDMLTAAAAAFGRSYTPDPRPEAGGFFRSDHFPFAKAGVPAVSFGSGRDLIEGGVARGNALSSAYGESRYHQPADEWSADMDFSGMVADARLLHALAGRLANSDAWPNWSSDSEFRAARDTSDAARR